MKNLKYVIYSILVFCARANAGTALFDFDDPSLLHRPLPLSLTAGGITADLEATGQGFSIQDTQQAIAVLPSGFSGQGLVPNGISASDLIVSFPQETVTGFSIMVAPQDLKTDSTATLRVTAFMNGVLVGTSTSTGSPPYFWPSSTLSFSSPQGFNSVVVHYDSPPPTGGDFGTIFVADNMIVTAGAVPEPGGLVLLGIGALGLLGRRPWIRPNRSRRTRYDAKAARPDSDPESDGRAGVGHRPRSNRESVPIPIPKSKSRNRRSAASSGTAGALSA